MFSYIDPEIRKKLKNDKRLATINRQGIPTSQSENSDPYISILGPIPMPSQFSHGTTYHWYPFVRRTELTSVLDASKKVTSGSDQTFRDLINSNMSVNSVVASKNFTCSGGSSSVFNSALNAAVDSMCTSSMI